MILLSFIRPYNLYVFCIFTKCQEHVNIYYEQFLDIDLSSSLFISK